jgi:hypothetical protein
LAGTLKQSTRFHMLAVDDLGAVVAAVFAAPERYLGRKLDIAGDIMTIPDMLRTYARVTGARPKRWKLPNLILRLFAKDFAAQLRWHNRVNWSFSPQVLRDIVPGASRFEDFLAITRYAISKGASRTRGDVIPIMSLTGPSATARRGRLAAPASDARSSWGALGPACWAI